MPRVVPGRRPLAEARCAAQNRRGVRCSGMAIKGGTVCTAHGGRAPQVRAAAAARHAAEQQQRLAGRFLAMQGTALVDIDPVQEFIRQIRQAAALERAYAAILEAGDCEIVVESAVQGQRPSAFIELWNGERDRLVKFMETAAKLGIEERRLKVEVESMRQVAEGVLGALDDERAALTVEQRQALRTIMAERLRSIA